MKRQIGDKDFPIWLLGDSNPKNWADSLDTPLDPRHPARHNIWTPVLDVIQDKVFRGCRKRVDTTSLFIRNAIGDPDNKPKGNSTEWQAVIQDEVRVFHGLIDRYKPKLVLCFGAFAFEFTRRAMGQGQDRPYSYWGAKRLGQEFTLRVDHFDINTTNILPLLHVSIARGRFIQSHNYFCNEDGANYFDYVGAHIAEKLIAYQNKLDIWID